MRCRCALVLVCVVFALPAKTWGAGGYSDPLDYGRQARAVVADDKLEVVCQETKSVLKTNMVEEQRIREVEVDGEFREEVYTVRVPMIVTEQFASRWTATIPLAEAEVYHVDGGPVPATALRQSLARRATVLVATRKVPRYYLGVYKPDTLLVVVKPAQIVYPQAAPPAPADAPQPAAPVEQAVAARAPGAQPAAAAEESFGLAGVQPTVQFLRQSDGKFSLREHRRQTWKETQCYYMESNGRVVCLPTEVAVDAVSDTVRAFDPAAVRTTRVDGRELPSNQLARLLATERSVLVSADGRPVDPSFLGIVRPEALVVVGPQSQTPGGGMMGPAPAPTPVAPVPATPVPVESAPRPVEARASAPVVP